MKLKIILLLFFSSVLMFATHAQLRPAIPGSRFSPLQQLDDRDEGEGAIKYFNELEEKIKESNHRNGVTSDNRNLMRYNAWKDAMKNSATYATTNGNWTSVHQAQSTIGTGRIECVAFNPTDPNTFYLGTAGGGMWRTQNNGVSYQPVTDGLATSGVSAICVDYTAPNTLYIATGPGFGGQSATSIGVLKTTDAGATFTETGLKDTIGGFAPLVIYDMKMHPTDHNTLFAATNRGLYRTQDGGGTWTLVLVPNDSPGYNDVFDVDFNPSDASIVYASYYYKLYVSKTSGNSGTWVGSPVFSNYPTTWNGNYAARIAVSAANPNGIYIASAVSSTDAVRNVNGDVFLISATYNSVSNSISLTTPKKVTACSQVCIRSGGGRVDGDIYVSQTDASQIMVGGLETFSTTTGGTSWVLKSINCATSARNFHVDIGCINYNNNQLYVTVDGGIYRQSNADFGSSSTPWTDITRAIEITQLYTHDGSPQDDQYYLYANQDNSVHIRTSLTSYTSFIGGDGTACKFDQTDKQIYYGTIQNGEFMYRSDHGPSYQLFPGVGSGDGDTAQYSGTFNFAKCFMLDENVSTTVYAAKRNFYKSINKGGAWTIKYTGATTPQVIMRVAKANSSVVYLYQDNGTLRRSTTGGDSWSDITANLPANVYLSDIGFDPDAATWVYITCYGNIADKKVFRSTDGGVTFSTNFSSGLPNVDIRCIKVVGGVSNEVYVGTDVGVFYRNDNIGHWVNFSNGLPVVQVNSIYINPTYQTISVGTFGRGIWTSPLYGGAGCPVNISLVSSYVYRNVFSASGTITSTGTIIGDVNSNIKFSAANVVLSPGFIAQQNSNFRAVPEGCNPQPEILKTGATTADSSVIKTNQLTVPVAPLKQNAQKGNKIVSGGKIKKD